MRTYVLGIDPGASGGIARLWGTGHLEVWRMPKGGNEKITELFYEVLDPFDCAGIVIEQVWGRETDGKRQITTFMKHVGFLEGTVRARLRESPDTPLVWVPPTKWQAFLGCPKAPSRKDEPKAHIRKRIHKNDLKDYAGKLFPSIRLTLCTCDAALIALYAGKTILEEDAE